MEDKIVYCDNCEKHIEYNAVLHLVHCKKNFKLCQFCKELVPICDMKTHIETRHCIDTCNFCKRPFEKWELENHEEKCLKKPVKCKFCELEVPVADLRGHASVCGSRTEKCSTCTRYIKLKDMEKHSSSCKKQFPKKPINCKFCELDVLEDDFKEHASMCWSRTEKCSTCAQYVMLKDLERHASICFKSSMSDSSVCNFCGDQFDPPNIDTHETICKNKKIRCPNCGDKINKYMNNHVCKAKKECCSMSIVRCLSCNKKFPTPLLSTHMKECHVNNRTSSNIKEPYKEVEVKRKQDVSTEHTFNKDRSPYHFQNHIKNQAIELAPPVQRNFAETDISAKWEISSKKNLPMKYMRDSRACPLCSYEIPDDRFDDHVRACALSKVHCYSCGDDFFSESSFQEHHKHCTDKVEKKGKKKDKGKQPKENKKENEGFFDKFFGKGFGGRKKAHQDLHSFGTGVYITEKQFEKDGIPCEFCNEVFPFEDIILHQSGCRPDLVKYEVPEASGSKIIDYSQYMMTDDRSNSLRSADRASRKERVAENFSNDSSLKFSNVSKSGRDFDLSKEDFSQKHSFNDYKKGVPVERNQSKVVMGIEKEKTKKDVLFTFSSAAKKNFSVEERIIEQGVRPKTKSRENLSQKHLFSKGVNHFSDSDEESSPRNHAVKAVGFEREQRSSEPGQINNFCIPTDSISKNSLQGVNHLPDSDEESIFYQKKSSSLHEKDTFSSRHHALKAVGFEREQKKTSSEPDQGNNFCISTDSISKNYLQDESSFIPKKKGSLNSDDTNESSDNVYVSCDEGEDFSEIKSLKNNFEVPSDNQKGDFKSTDSVDLLFEKIHLFSKENKMGKNHSYDCDLEKEVDMKNKETFDSHFDQSLDFVGSINNPQYSYEEASYFPPYSVKNSVSNNNSTVDMKSKMDKENTSDLDQTLVPFKSDDNPHHRFESSYFPKYSVKDSVSNNNSTVDMKSKMDKENTSDLDQTLVSFKSDNNPHHRFESSYFPKYSVKDSKSDSTSVDISEMGKKNKASASEFHNAIDPLTPIYPDHFRCETSYFTSISDNNSNSIHDTSAGDDLDAYLQFLGVGDSEISILNRSFEDMQLGANNTYSQDHKPPQIQEPVVEVEDLNSASKNKSSYVAPFLVEGVCEEMEVGCEPNFPVFLQEENRGMLAKESGSEVRVKSEEEQDNDANWQRWRTPRQLCSDD